MGWHSKKVKPSQSYLSGGTERVFKMGGDKRQGGVCDITSQAVACQRWVEVHQTCTKHPTIACTSWRHMVRDRAIVAWYRHL